MSKQKAKKLPAKGILVKIIYLWILLLLLSILSLSLLIFLKHSFKVERRAYQELTEVIRVIDMVNRQSSYMSLQIRSFVISGNTKDIANYWRYVDRTKKLEDAIKNLSTMKPLPQEVQQLMDIKKLSNEARVMEVHAIKLLMSAYQVAPDLLSNDVKSYVLTPEEKLLSPDEKQKRAHDLLFSRQYTDMKTHILQSLSALQTTLGKKIQNSALHEVEKTNNLISLLIALLVIQIFVVMSIIWLRAFVLKE